MRNEVIEELTADEGAKNRATSPLACCILLENAPGGLLCMEVQREPPSAVWRERTRLWTQAELAALPPCLSARHEVGMGQRLPGP